LQADCVSLLLNKEIDLHLLDHLVQIYQPGYIWIPEKDLLSFPNWQFCVSISSYSLLKNLETVRVTMPSELALLLTTSGSTGSPRLVRLSKKNLMSNAESIVDYLHITKEEKPITSLPMYYSYGLSILNSHLITGATILLTDYSYIQKEFWNFAEEKECTSFAGVPFTYEILKKIRFWDKSIPTLKTLTQAGGKLDNSLLEYFITNAHQRNIRFYLMYGQTEATARMSYLPLEQSLEKLGSIGIAIPGGHFELKNSTGDLISESNQIGELVYKGDNVSLGYAECAEDLMRGDDNQSVLFTGDLAYYDQDGFYYITGRKKRFLKLFGNRISLDYTENLLRSICNNCVCVGTDNKMIIYITEQDKSEEILLFLTNTTKLNRIAFEVRHIDKIPRSNTGKILYSDLSVI
jgi:acyl-CoA synthetase (AMP-forming)/AMP-acid ligase II